MSAYQETKIHGTHAFPYVVYMGLLPEYISGFPFHWHEEMEIIAVREGTVDVTVRNTEYVVHSGDLVLIQPQMIHAIKQHGEEKALYFNILFRFSMLESGADDVCREKYLEPLSSHKLLMPELIDVEHPLNQVIMPLVQSLLQEPRQQRHQEELLIKARLFEIMHHIMPYCSRSDKSREYEDIIYDKLKRSLEYMEENFVDNISVEEVAAISNYSESHFSKLFKQLTGISFAQYLKNYRLEMAADQLLNSTGKVSEIAMSCGFSNLSYFSRAFCHKYGVTPSEFRQQHRQ